MLSAMRFILVNVYVGVSYSWRIRELINIIINTHQYHYYYTYE